jgi:hypothetical protein
MILRKLNALLLLTAIGLNLSSVAQASLVDRGEGMIYDDVLDVTWLKDANYAKTSGYTYEGEPGWLKGTGQMNWSRATEWAENLSYGGYNDWRLPSVNPVNFERMQHSSSNDGSTDIGINISSTQSEMGYMFYQNLGNAGCNGTDLCLTNTGIFNNLQPDSYWSSRTFTPGPRHRLAYVLDMDKGKQRTETLANPGYAWAVRSGDVAVVPAPATAWLLGSSLLGLAGLSRRRKI